MTRLPDCVLSSGVRYVVRLSERAGVVATCTTPAGRTIILDVLESWPGPVIFRRDHSAEGRELAHHVAAWFEREVEPRS